ncbi:hypothetical protein V6N13_018658, partial [Hibiscus sabdariffa]
SYALEVGNFSNFSGAVVLLPLLRTSHVKCEADYYQRSYSLPFLLLSFHVFSLIDYASFRETYFANVS